MEIPHSNFSKVPRVIFIEVGAMMMLSTCHTATTGMFAMLAYAAVASGDVAAAVEDHSS